MNGAKDILDDLNARGLYRRLKSARPRGAYIECGGVKYVNFACNDYLGISADIELQKDFLAKFADEKSFVMSSVSSRLLGGDNPAFEELESFLASVYTAASNSPKSCLCFNGGYHANNGIIPALATSKDLILADKLVHASIIDCLKLSEAKWLRFAHNDCNHLRSLLEKNRDQYRNVFIITEGVFSMDGDRADIVELVKIKKQYDAFLYVDEAHSIGVFGEDGLGLCSATQAAADVDLIMGTLGKALASQGAFAICSGEVKELLINKCRPFIFTTAIAPINAMWSRFVFERMMKMKARRTALQNISKLLRAELTEFDTLGNSQIVPVVLGESEVANKTSQKLLSAGIWAPAVRWPTVPKGAARLRLSLNADMDVELVRDCARKIAESAK